MIRARAAPDSIAFSPVCITAGQNTRSASSFKETKSSGLSLTDGGVFIGSTQQSDDNKNQQTTAAASTVGSIGGNVTLLAGNRYRQVGSDVLAPVGDVTIIAKKVDIVEARETSATQTESKFKQSGLSLSISNPLITAGQGIQQIGQAISDTSSGRMKALGVASGALTGYNTFNSLTDSAGNFSLA